MVAFHFPRVLNVAKALRDPTQGRRGCPSPSLVVTPPIGWLGIVS